MTLLWVALALLVGGAAGYAACALTLSNTNDYTRGFQHGYAHAHLELDDHARKE